MTRFNTLSLWSTTCVLREGDLSLRCSMYSKLVSLASHLLDLGNYHAAMAIITSLRQGCITRLHFTVSRLDKKTKDTFLELQVRPCRIRRGICPNNAHFSILLYIYECVSIRIVSLTVGITPHIATSWTGSAEKWRIQRLGEVIYINYNISYLLSYLHI
jgi:RasGEF domain